MGGRTGQFVGQARPSGEQGHGQGLQIKLGLDGRRGEKGANRLGRWRDGTEILWRFELFLMIVKKSNEKGVRRGKVEKGGTKIPIVSGYQRKW